ncbi:tetratricopeptide repeat protein [candidate division KSB1 bacterium]|nr:tetratricopeptide repeat protein [candidate division KSB1 bacterium]
MSLLIQGKQFHCKLCIVILMLFATCLPSGRLRADDLQTSSSPEMKIDYWLSNFNQIIDSEKAQIASDVFNRIFAVSDKPIDILPQLYVFSDLALQQLVALPDGSIILPEKVIDFCLRNKDAGKAQLAFLIGHELKHVVKSDYWKLNQIMQFVDDVKKQDQTKEFRNILEKIHALPVMTYRKEMETQADEYGILYAALAGFPVASIVSPTNSFISDYYRAAKINIHGDLTNNSLKERIDALNLRLERIQQNIPLFEIGTKLYVISQFDEAIDLLTKFLAQYPSREVYNNIGLCHYQLALQNYLKLQPESMATNPNFIYLLSLQFDPASRYVLVTRNVNNKYQTKFRYHIESAIVNFEKAKELDKFYAVASNNLGCAHLLKGNLEFAQGYIKNAIELNTDYAEAYNNLAITYLAQQNYASAEKYLSRAIQLRPSYAEPYYNLSVANQRLKNKDVAMQFYQNFMHLAPFSLFTQRLADMLNEPLQTEPVTFWWEPIDGVLPTNISLKHQAEYQSFRTEAGVVTMWHKADDSVEYSLYATDQNAKKIIMIQANENYAKSTVRNIKIGSPLSAVQTSYNVPCTRVSVTTGEYLIYANLKLIFNIVDNHVRSWFLYDIF